MCKVVCLAVLVGLLTFSTNAAAQTATTANIRCHNGTNFVNCPISSGGSGDVDANTVRVTMGGEPCSGKKVPFSVRSTAAGTTQLIAASVGNKAYICSLSVGPISTTANIVGIVEDDTASCASPTAGMMGSTTAGDAWPLPASGGFRDGGANASIAITAATNRYVCVITSSNATTAVYGTYVLAP